MTQEQFRLELQNAVEQYLEGIRTQNGASAAAMEDAINRYLLKLKDMVLQELLVAASQPIQEQSELKEEEESGEQHNDATNP